LPLLFFSKGRSSGAIFPALKIPLDISIPQRYIIDMSNKEPQMISEALTFDQRRRIVEAIEDCSRFIEREEKRDPALRPASVSKTLAHYKLHMARMAKCLEENRMVPA
jgi:hypothetical protein